MDAEGRHNFVELASFYLCVRSWIEQRFVQQASLPSEPF